MLCQICKKNAATIHYKSNVNGVVNEKYMCNDCASAVGATEKGKNKEVFNTADVVDSFFDNTSDALFGGLFGEMLGSKNSPQPARNICKSCGMRYGDFVHKGKFGCEKCYEAFEAYLVPTLKRIHGNTKYCGKTPSGYEKKETVKDRIEALRELLNKAVENQEYEKAAQYRDEIRELEKKEEKEGK